MKTIGIIGAMEEEIENIKPHIDIISTKNIVGLDFYMGKMSGNNVVLVRSGIGKVNAAICSQVLIDLYAVDYIINVGVAGAINKDLKIGDIVVATDVMHHDMDTTYFGDELGIIPRMEESCFKADEELMNIAVNSSTKETENTIFTGRIVSGDQFLCDIDKKNKIWSHFKAYCVDMESAAIGQTCYLNKIPFCIIRSISDNSDENNDYENFFRDSAIKASNILKNMIEVI
ncbi:5'-methylthioadenosine/adenosylhomocysteine nucleosidase [[Clostridium] colinum]|uniref:5'-methylthioadenosine/adenosylhomocysteine nucleosidase n=1 Tax=[Clostridium] colinum TaxID=36835 RepID=UPI0020255ADE|nr:5'-methylthioadenosine/adenosylhomocysteine nucleosidase [[Clostridium] colinum]